MAGPVSPRAWTAAGSARAFDHLVSVGVPFVRYADDCNIYVRSRRAGERVLDSVERFVTEGLRLRVNRDKSAVDRPWNRKFLGYTVTTHRQPKLKVAPKSVRRLKQKLRDTFRRGRLAGRTMRAAVAILRDYRRTLELYTAEQIRAVATSAVREARNADTFLDRVLMTTGLDIIVIDTSEDKDQPLCLINPEILEASGL